MRSAGSLSAGAAAPRSTSVSGGATSTTSTSAIDACFVMMCAAGSSVEAGNAGMVTPPCRPRGPPGRAATVASATGAYRPAHARRAEAAVPATSAGCCLLARQRLGVAAGIIVFIAVLTWLDRGGYSDADGTPISVLDSLYYSTVTATTTGYGDIAPVSPRAAGRDDVPRHPARGLFLIVLVGTTLELLTERFRRSRLEARWRSPVKDHIIVAGYGTVGRSAIETLLAGGTTLTGTDRRHRRRRRRGDPGAGGGLVAIGADATHASVWTQARVESARAVIVTCNRDDTATLVTLTVRDSTRERAHLGQRPRGGERAAPQPVRRDDGRPLIRGGRPAGRAVDRLAGGRPRHRGPLVGRPGDRPGGTARPPTRARRPTTQRGRGARRSRAGSARIAFDDDDFQRTAPGDIVVCLVRSREP